MQMKRSAILALLILVLPEFAGAQSLPQVFTGPATAVESQSAVVTGDVNPMGTSATAWFEYGPSFGLGNRTQTEFVGSGSSQVRIAATLPNLQPNTTYYYRTVAQGSSFGLQNGSIQTFVTKSGTGTGGGGIINLPTVSVSAPTNLRNTSVTLHGKILPNGSDTSAWFEYGTTSAVPNRSESRIAAATQAGLELNFHLGALRAGTTYYYRLAAQNSQGVSRTEIKTFTTTGTSGGGTVTPPAPAPTSTPSAPATSTPSAGFNAVLTLIATSDQTQPVLGTEFNYNLEYRNDGTNPASNTILRVTLPQEVEFVQADLVPNIEGKNLSFNLGTIAGNIRKTVRLRLRAKEDAAPLQVSIPALLTYRTPKNEERSASASVSLVLQEKNAENSTSTGEFGGLRWYTWLFLFLLLVIALAVAYVLYRYGKSKRSLG
jgi:uncharacterized repeat protein (TIGR01451 family)